MRHVYLDLDLDRYVTTFYWGHRATATYCIKQLSLFGSKTQASSEYWIHFTARFGGVHAFGYNSTESEPIWMKSGALRVHCRGLALADFRRDPRKSDSCRARRNFVCFFVRQAMHDFTDFPSAKFHEIWTPISVAMKTFGTEFWKFYRKGSFLTFFPKKRKYFSKILTSCDFRQAWLRNDYIS